MKFKTLLIVMALASGVVFTLYSQDKKKAADEKSVTWLGVDFTAAKVTLAEESETTILNNFKSINMVIISEPEKYNFEKSFNKTEVKKDIEMINELNSKIDPSGIKTMDDFKLDLAEVTSKIKNYNLTGKTGMGLVFIAEDLNKPKLYGSYYVCFFDMGTKEIIDMRRFEGKPTGIGFRNYWAGSIYSIMKGWLKS